MVTRTYKSTDAGAPVLTGQVDSLNNLLKAILVNGIGGAPATPWTLSYEDAASHICVFRPPAGNRHYLQSNDNGPGTSTFKEARMRGYVAMTAYNTGTEPFPTVAQQANGVIARKSATLDATARVWRAYVDEKTMYLFIDCGDTAGMYDMYAFGQYLDWVPSGAYGSIIMGRFTEVSTTRSTANNSGFSMYPNAPAVGKIYAARDYTGSGTATELCVVYDSAAAMSGAVGTPGTLGNAYPYPVDSGIILMPYRLSTTTMIVGRLRGMWIPGHPRPLVQDDTFTATEGALTRAFAAQNFMTTGQLMPETSDTWDND